MIIHTSWWGLSWQERREVLREARRGNWHERPEVAAAAWQWADGLLSAKSTLRRDGGIAVLLAALGPAASGGWFGMSVAERRAAKRIHKLGPPPGGPTRH